MTRLIDSANYTALQNAAEEGGIYRRLVTFFPKDLNGSALSPACFWNGNGDYDISVIDPKTGLSTVRNFSGDGALLEVNGIEYTQGLVITTAQVILSPLDAGVRNMFSGTIIRNCRVEIHELQFGISTGAPVGPAFVSFVGSVDKAPLDIGGVGSESTIKVDVVSRVRSLTRSRAEKKSDEFMKAQRSGDRFRRYNDTANVRIWWGGKKDKAAASQGNSVAINSGQLTTNRFR